MGLFSKKPSADKLLLEALSDYKSSRFDDCYKKVCEASELGSARASFCKALLIYNDNVNPDSTPDAEVLLDLASRAMDGGYALAYGFYAFILYIDGQKERLCEFLKGKSKVRDGVYLSYKASYLFGLYTDEENADRKTTLSVILDSVAALTEQKEKLLAKKSVEYEECELYNPYGKFSIDYTYAHAQFILLTYYYCENDWNDRRAFMAAFEEIVSQMPLVTEKFRAIAQYLRAIFKNYLGMSDFSEANRAMKIFNECYNELSDEEKDAYCDEYSEIYDKYDSFYDEQAEIRANRDVTYSDGYADKNDISLGNVVKAFAEGASRWANTSSETKTTYTIDGKEYTRGDEGYLYDESGMRSGYRVDDYARLHDESDRELGYFNTNGNFINN